MSKEDFVKYITMKSKDWYEEIKKSDLVLPNRKLTSSWLKKCILCMNCFVNATNAYIRV